MGPLGASGVLTQGTGSSLPLREPRLGAFQRALHDPPSRQAGATCRGTAQGYHKAKSSPVG
jgi:hypothetical protein